jgi:decaprenylphospho-beta-D-ribofuranose 2-oxidase
MELSGWGRYPVVSARCARPERRAELFELMESREGEPMLAHGLGRSYGDAALLRDGRVVLTRRLDRMLSFDEETGRLWCEAGVSIDELVRTFLPRGYFPPVVPGTRFVTVGGAVGCNIHGKNHVVAGCFGDHVLSLEVLSGEGRIVRCSREENADLFAATIGGMGLTGLVLTAEIRLTRVESPLIEMESTRFDDLDEFFELSAASREITHTVAWIDCLSSRGRGIFMRGRHGGEAAREGIVDRLVEQVQRAANGRLVSSNHLLNRATIAAFNEVYFRRHRKGTQRAVVAIDPFFFPLDSIENWNHIYGDRGFLQYQLVVGERDALRACLGLIAESGLASFLAVIKEFGDHDHGGLSFPQKGFTLALDFPNVGEPLLELMERLDGIVIEAGGRVYLGKDARLSRKSFQRMYPAWEKWKAVRDAWDADGVFQSELGRRLWLC